MRPLLALLLSFGTSACGLYFPADSGDDGEGGEADDLYVAAGDQGALLSSPDAINWTVRTSGTSSTFHDVTYADDHYVAVGQAGKIVVSTDGVTWSTAASPSSKDLYAVVHHIDRFYAVGGDYSAGAETLESVDGTTWTRPELAAPLHLLTDLASDGNELVAIGSYQSDQQIFGLFSWVEGAGWVQRIDGTGIGLRYNAVAAGPSLVIIGVGGAAQSSNAIDWTPAQIFDPTVPRGLAYTQQGWFAVGDAGKLLRSADAVAWTAGATGVDVELRGVVSNGTSFVAVGASGTILSSGDGAVWVPQLSPVSANLRAVTHPRG